MIIRRSRAVALVVLAVLLLSALLGGCARVRAALAVQPDDTVTGELVFATPAKSADDKGPTVTLPPELASDVDVTAYRRTATPVPCCASPGSPSTQTAALTRATFPANDRVQFDLRRAGGRVLVTGSVDLTTGLGRQGRLPAQDELPRTDRRRQR